MLIAGTGRRSVHKRLGNTGNVFSLKPSFWLPLLDAGSGAVNVNPLIAIGNGTPTSTRATAAWTKLSTGLWASVASGTARSLYLGQDTTVGAYGGYLAEGARTNYALWNRDLTNAAWVVSNLTDISTAKTATGIDGAANSATTLTAAAGNGTILQAITLASQANIFQPFVKRRTGTGVINITIDGGATWTPITINATTYTQVSVTKTAANPSIGFQIVTNGDAIDVDMADVQGGAFASTPIPTTTTALARNADVLTYPSALNIAIIGAAYVEVTSLPGAITSPGSYNYIITTYISGGGVAIYVNENGDLKQHMYTGLVVLNGASYTGSTSIQKLASSWDGVSNNMAQNGAVTAGANGATFAPGAILGIGTRTDGLNGTQWNGTIRNVRIYPKALTAAQLQAMTT